MEKTDSKQKIKIGIFIKLLFILVFLSVVPTVVCFFLTLSTYQNIIEMGVFKKYLPRGNIEIEKELFEAQKEIRLKATILLLIVIFITIFLCVLTTKSFIKPLRELFRGTKEVAKGNLDIKIKKYSEDEIGQLVDAFNEMVREVKKTRELLEEEKRALEVKIRARTKQLQDFTQTLEEKIQARTQRLQEKIKELEKFQEIANQQKLEIENLKKQLAQK